MKRLIIILILLSLSSTILVASEETFSVKVTPAPPNLSADLKLNALYLVLDDG